MGRFTQTLSLPILPLMAWVALALPAEAKEKKLCPQPEEFYDEIYNCGYNIVAVSYGKACADAQIAMSRTRGAALVAVMSDLKLGQAQNTSMGDAQKRLALAVNELGSQIQAMQKNTELVAGYTAPMIDYADSTSDKTSLDCFNSNFHALQKIVTGLDNEIIQTKRVRERALDMLQTLAGRSKNLNSVAQQAPVKATGRGPASVPSGAQRVGQDVRQSDVSGTKKVDEAH